MEQNEVISIQDVKFQTFTHPDGVQKVTTHWDYANQFSSRAVYVPIEKLAECMDGIGGVLTDASGWRHEATPKYFVNNWKNSRPHMDAFVIPKVGMTSNLIVGAMGTGSLSHTAVLRYGNGEADYMIVQCNPQKLEALINEWKPEWKDNPENTELVRFGGLLPDSYYGNPTEGVMDIEFDNEKDSLESFSEKVNQFIDGLKKAPKAVPVIEEDVEEIVEEVSVPRRRVA